jgi:glucosylceramidase
MTLRTLILALGLAAAAVPRGLAADAAQIWVTSADGRQRLTQLPPIPFDAETPRGLRIHVDESRRYQPIEGFGASFTESSAWLIQHRMSAAQRDALMRELFDPGTGLGLGVTRLPMGGSDFSLTHGTYDDVPAGETDAPLARFSIERSRTEVLPLVRQALRINPGLKVFISPWSAPAWMKTSGSLITGKLDPRHYDAFARYFDATLAAFKAENVPVYALTIQNEPHFEPADYPGMRVEPAERAAFIAGHLGPLLAKKWPGVRLLDWDHNWDEPQSPLGVLGDPKARPFVAGVAWHCYGGEVSAQSKVHEKYPEIETWMTECSGGGWSPKWSEDRVHRRRQVDQVPGPLQHPGHGPAGLLGVDHLQRQDQALRSPVGRRGRSRCPQGRQARLPFVEQERRRHRDLDHDDLARLAGRRLRPR